MTMTGTMAENKKVKKKKRKVSLKKKISKKFSESRNNAEFHIGNFKDSINSSLKANVEYAKKVAKDKSDNINAAKQFLLIIIFYGFLINYSLNALAGFSFSFYTFPAYGIVYYFIKDEFVEWIRGVLAKK